MRPKPLNSRLDDWASLALWLVMLGVMLVFLWVMADIVLRGVSSLSWEFLFTIPEDSGRAGGISSILVATLLILCICLATSIPIGLGTAVFLAEFTSRNSAFARWVRLSLDVLAGMPSIVFGLFGAVFFVKILNLGFSIMAGGLTLTCMTLPIIIKATEQGFRSVPNEYRLGTAALGMSRWSSVMHVLWISAMPGLLVGTVLGMGRALAETAALIFTSGYVDRMPGSLLDSGRALSIHIFDLSMNVPGGNDHAYASALVLVSLLLSINTLANWIAKRFINQSISLA